MYLNSRFISSTYEVDRVFGPLGVQTRLTINLISPFFFFFLKKVIPRDVIGRLHRLVLYLPGNVAGQVSPFERTHFIIHFVVLGIYQSFGRDRHDVSILSLPLPLSFLFLRCYRVIPLPSFFSIERIHSILSNSTFS